MPKSLQAIGNDAKIPKPLQRVMHGLNPQFQEESGPMSPLAGGLGPDSHGMIAGVEQGRPNTISVMQPGVFAKNADQLATHEDTHLWQNNLPPALQAKIPADNPKDPYNYGGTSAIQSLVKRGGTLLDLPREQQAAAMQYGQVQGMPEPYKSLANTMNSIPLSTVDMTDPNAKEINTHPRAPLPPIMNYATDTYKKGQPAPGDDDIDLSAGLSPAPAKTSGASDDIDLSAGMNPAPQAAPPTPMSQKAFGANPVSGTLSSVGSHLLNMVAGPYHAFTDAPQNPAEQRIKSLPGNSGILGQLDLGAARMFAEPTAKAIKQVGAQAKAGNYGLGLKDTTYDDQGNYQPTALSSAMDAVPIAGPWARGVETEAHQKGALPALAGLGTDILAPIGAGKLIGKGAAAAGYGVRAASSTPESLTMAGTRAVTKGTPGQLLQSALKPGVKYGAGVSANLESALPDVINADPNLKGVSGFAKASDAARDTQYGKYNDLISPYRSLKYGEQGPVRPSAIPGGPIGQAQISSIPTMDLLEDPATSTGRMRTFNVNDPEGGSLKMGAYDEPRGGIANRTKDIASRYDKSFDIPTMDAIREDANAKLNAFYNKSGGDQAAALSNPETARVKAVGDTTRSLLYPELEQNAGLAPGAVADMQGKYGNLVDASDIANRREPVFARHDPVTLSQKIAVGHGGPIATAFNWAKEKGLQRLTNSDALVNSAIDRFQNPAATPLMPRTGALPSSFFNLGGGLRKLGGGIDNTSRYFPIARSS